MESNIFEDALWGTPPQTYDDDDFLDTLDQFSCKSRVTIMNVYGVILQIAKAAISAEAIHNALLLEGMR